MIAQTLSVALLISCAALVAAGQSVEIDLTDANQALLGLELSKSVKGVQEALADNFRFNYCSEVDMFVRQCALIKNEMKQASDEDFGGLAKLVKALMANQQVATACKVPNYEDFCQLEAEFRPEEAHYLGASRLAKLVQLRQRMDTNPSLATVFNHLYNEVSLALGRELIKEAAHDFEMLVGERAPMNDWLELGIHYKRGCAISELKPICKLVRRTSYDDVTAVGRDMADFGELLRTNDHEKLFAYSKAAGMPMNNTVLRSHLSTVCKKFSKQAFKPMSQIEGYLAAGLLRQDQVADQMRAQSELDLYYKFYQMCKLV